MIWLLPIAPYLAPLLIKALTTAALLFITILMIALDVPLR